MFKTILNMLAGAFVAAAVGAAFAVTGNPPVNGFQTPDGTWLLGLAGGQNQSYQYGIVAHAGGTQAACTVLPSGSYLMQVDTVATNGDSVCLPFAVAGTNVQIHNNSANTLNIYGQAGNNLLTGAADTINDVAGSTPEIPVAHGSVDCFVAKNGNWSCVKGI